MGRCPDCQATLIKKYSSAANQAVLEKYTPDDRGSISQLFCELMRTLDRNLEQNERIEDFFEGAFKMAKNNHQYNTAEMLDKFLRMISDEIIQIEYKRKISADQYEKRKIQEGIYAALLQRAEHLNRPYRYIDPASFSFARCSFAPYPCRLRDTRKNDAVSRLHIHVRAHCMHTVARYYPGWSEAKTSKMGAEAF